jgi:glucose-1-phosphate thymidylyltransferase
MGMRVSKALIVLERGAPGHGWRSLDVRNRHLVAIANRPLIVHAIEGLERAGIEQVGIVADEVTLAATQQALATHPGRVRTTYIPRKHGAGTVACLLAARGFVDGEPVLVHTGDGVLGPRLGKLLDGFEEEPLDALVLLEPPDGRARRGVRAALDLVGRRTAADEVDRGEFSGLCVVGPIAVRAAEHAARGRGEASWTDFLVALEHLRASVEARPMDGWCRCRCDDGEASLLRATRVALDLLPAAPPSAGVSWPDVEVQGRALIDPTASLTSTTVRGPVVIGARSRISNAFLGPYTSIGEDVVIEGTEIENSIVHDGARVSHVPNRLEGSVLGRCAKVSVDFELPRGLRLTLGEGAEVVFS